MKRFGVAGRELRDAAWRDVRYALRTLRGSPGFTGVAAATLALAVGATTAVFSVADGVLLRPLDFRQPDRIVRLLEYHADGSGRGTISAPNFFDWMERTATLAAGALYDEYRPTLRLGDEVLKVEAASVGASFFDVLGVRPVAGRFFLPEEDAGEARRVVLSWGLWRERFGGDAGVVGRAIDLDGEPYTVVGVAPPMEDPRLSFSIRESPRLWRSPPPYFRTTGRGGRSFTAIARLASGVSLDQARADIAAVHAGLAEEHPEHNAGRVLRVVPLKDDVIGPVRAVLWLLIAAVGLVLVIACANVANLLLFRATARAREIGVRLALGAPRGRIVRQLMVESLMLAMIGAAGGIVVAALGTGGLIALAGGELPRADGIGIDTRVLAFALAATVAAALAFGLLPALHTTRVDPRAALAGGGRGATAGRAQARVRQAVVAAQVGLAVVVMLGATLLGRSLLRLQAVDPGIAVERLLVLRIDPPGDPYSPWTADGRTALLGLNDRLTERLAALPGVDAVGITDLLPMSGSFNGNAFHVVGRPEPGAGEYPSAETRAVSPGYLAAVGMPLHEGRGFTAADDDGAERVVLVDRSFVQRHFADGGAVGEHIILFDPALPPARIVGVVGDVTQFSPDRAPEPVIYVPMAQAPAWMRREPWIALRTAGDPAALTAAARTAIREVEPRTPVYAERPMRAVVDQTMAAPRFRTVLLLTFAGIAVLLAGIGVYGMVAYSVARRLPELGVRMAIGADANRILRHVVGDGLRPVLLGAAAGLLVGLPAVHLLRRFLFGVAPTDPVAFLAAPVALAALAALAAWLPARRAARLSPATVLRAE